MTPRLGMSLCRIVSGGAGSAGASGTKPAGAAKAEDDARSLEAMGRAGTVVGQNLVAEAYRRRRFGTNDLEAAFDKLPVLAAGTLHALREALEMATPPDEAEAVLIRKLNNRLAQPGVAHLIAGFIVDHTLDVSAQNAPTDSNPAGGDQGASSARRATRRR